MASEINYKELLEKYFVVVEEYEGYTFIGDCLKSGLPFSEEEIDELWRISKLRNRNGKLVLK
jgi:hypothetical protein